MRFAVLHKQRSIAFKTGLFNNKSICNDFFSSQQIQHFFHSNMLTNVLV